MEALTAVSVAALTVYDMCKALSHEIVIEEICLVEKTGGKADYLRRVMLGKFALLNLTRFPWGL